MSADTPQETTPTTERLVALLNRLSDMPLFMDDADEMALRWLARALPGMRQDGALLDEFERAASRYFDARGFKWDALLSAGYETDESVVWLTPANTTALPLRQAMTALIRAYPAASRSPETPR